MSERGKDKSTDIYTSKSDIMILSFNTKYEHLIAISKKIITPGPFHQPFNKKIDWGYKRKNLFLILITFVILMPLSFTSYQKSLFDIANAQRFSSCYEGVIMPSSSSDNGYLPVILIHGYLEDSRVWSIWESHLQDDGIPYCTVTFRGDDECGSAAAHAQELNQIVQRVKMLTHANQVNMVGHSKGGLDARVYLSNTQSPDVANLIMIGTPNAGDPLADETIRRHPELSPTQHNSIYCTPALFDLKTDALVTRVGENINTMYYTIYGDWNPYLFCSYYWLDYNNYGILDSPNDGVVPSWSVESLADYYVNYVNLEPTYHCHQDQTRHYEYDLSQQILKGE